LKVCHDYKIRAITEKWRSKEMKSVVIVGAGGFGREVLEIFKAQNKMSKIWHILGFIDENRELHGSIINNYPVLGGLDWLREHNNNNLGCVVAIGTCETRKQVVEKLQEIGVNFYNAIHPSVIMSEFVELGKDVIICAGSILTVNIRIGDHVHINLNSTIGHDAIIGSYCTINPTVKINGNNYLGEGVYVGTGATFIQGVPIGSWSTIGAGAIVIEDIPEKVVAVGVPAKVIKRKQ
jgi:sugar O-acyltransferase (sialic acid O-acetyltransferase NeuD family)